jgi:hypothetical protein
MPLRIGFDMDGTIADFETAFQGVELRLFGPVGSLRAGDPQQEEAAQAGSGAGRDDNGQSQTVDPREARRRREAIWAAIQATPNFWETLQPIDADAVGRIHGLMLDHHWEVFFITQRPETAGDTVQRQTQRWLVAQGFDLPSVLVLGGSRGAAAGALRLDYHVDDNLQNCLDVVADSRARPLLILPNPADEWFASAPKLGIGAVTSIGAALDILDQATSARHDSGLLSRLASIVGWR